MPIPMEWYLGLGGVIFAVGMFGFLVRRNMFVMLLSIELMLNAVNITMVTFSHYLNDLRGQIFTIFIMTVAAAEAAIGLAIIVTLFRNKATIQADEIKEMNG
ncbi:MAG: NADH-quinone oxidoreductase subunit NuoK [Nitrospiraceae bacterium]|jgi:NADH-quinone oxidoreductase subunit K|nr:NADH-quinone oxidoreductase subunit NuoK [Nitrospiraceae bacterium]